MNLSRFPGKKDQKTKKLEIFWQLVSCFPSIGSLVNHFSFYETGREKKRIVLNLKGTSSSTSITYRVEGWTSQEVIVVLQLGHLN